MLLDKLYVAIEANADGLGKGLRESEKKISGFEKAVNGGVDFIKTGLSNVVSTVGQAVSTSLHLITNFAGAAGAAISTQILAGGWNRALQIEKGKIVLEQFVGDTEGAVDNVMALVTKAVKGTAYSTDQAIQIATGAMAAGVEATDSLTDHIKAVNNTVALTGANYEWVGDIMNDIAAEGSLSTMQMNRLQAAGLGVSNMIAKHFNVSLAEANQMVKDGAIDYQTFMEVMGDLGDTAVEVGKRTFEGAVSNFKASMSRIGASLWDPIRKAATPAINDITAALSPLEAKFAEVFGKLGESIAPLLSGISDEIVSVLERIGDVLNETGDEISSGFGSKLTSLLPIIGGVVGAFGGFLGQIPFVGQLLGGLTGPIGIVIGLFAGVMASSEELRDAFQNAFETIVSYVQESGISIDDVLSGMQSVLENLGNALAPIVEAAGVIIGELLVAAIPIIESLLGVIDAIIQALQPVIDVLLAILIPLIQLVIDTVVSAVDLIVPLIEGALQVIQGVFEVIDAAIKGDWEECWEGIKNIFEGAWNFIKGILDIFLSIFGTSMDEIGEFWVNTLTSISEWASSTWDSVVEFFSNGIDSIVSFVSSIPDRIMSFFSDAGSWLLDAGANIINGFLSGIKSAFEGVKSFVSGIGSWIAAHKGPEEYDKKLLVPAGKQIIGGLLTGLKQDIGDVYDMVSGIGSNVRKKLEDSLESVNVPIINTFDGLSSFGNGMVPAFAGPGESVRNVNIRIDNLYVNKDDLDSGDLPADIEDIVRNYRMY